MAQMRLTYPAFKWLGPGWHCLIWLLQSEGPMRACRCLQEKTKARPHALKDVGLAGTCKPAHDFYGRRFMARTMQVHAELV